MTRVNGRAIEDYKRFRVTDTGLAVPRANPLYVPAISNGYRPDDFIVDDSLVLYLPLYLLKGSKFKSIDRYGHTATVIGAVWKPNGRDFSGNDDYITIPDHASITDIFDGGGSICLWSRPDSDGEGDDGVILGKPGGNLRTLTMPSEVGGKAFIRFRADFDVRGGSWLTTAREITIGSWTFLVLTYNADAVGNDPILYLNASSVAFTEEITPAGTRDSDSGDILYIGDYSGLNRAYDGLLGEMWFYNRILSQAEVTHMYNTTLWRYQ